MNVPKRNKLWNPAFVILLIASTLNTMSLFMSVPLVPKYMVSIGTALSVTGIIAGIGPLTSLVARPFSSVAADRFHKKRLLILFTILTGLTTLGYAATQNVLVFCVLRILNGMFFAVCGTTTFALASQFIPPQRLGEGIGYISLAQILAGSIGPTLGLGILDRLGYEGCFALICGLALVSAALLLPIADHGAMRACPTVQRRIRMKDLLAVNLVPLSILAGSFSLGNSLVMTFIAIMGDARGLRNVGVYFIVNAVVLVLIRPLAGKLYDQRGLKPILIPALILDALAMVFIAFSSSLWLIIAAAVLRAVGQGAGQPSIQAECVRIMGKDHSGLATGTYYAGSDFFQGLGAALGGIVVAQLGYQAMYLGAALVSVLTLTYFLGFQKNIFRAAERARETSG